MSDLAPHPALPRQRYMIKTIEREEKQTLLSILPQYAEHMHNFPRSLISRISGCYEITMYKQTKYFMVMDNLFDPANCPEPHEVSHLSDPSYNRYTRHNRRSRHNHCTACGGRFAGRRYNPHRRYRRYSCHRRHARSPP